MHGAGNDFIIVNIDKEGILRDKIPEIAKKLCARRTSLGADGFMAVVKAENGGDYGMLFYNSDGTVGEMCGNGARCIARYGYENGLAGETQKIETVSGMVIGRRIDKRRYMVRLNDPTVIDLDRHVNTRIGEISCAYIELGSPGLPHAIVRLDNFDRYEKSELFELGREIRWNPEFPKGANVTFCQINANSKVNAVTFERGVEDFTLACGTGAGSAAAALALLGLTDCENTEISMPGGVLSVSVDINGKRAENILLIGPTNIVAAGVITDEDLSI